MGPQTRVTRHLAASACALGNTRGAVFLLSIYLVSLSLLLLSGIALQRTQTEMRASQVSRDMQQAFWLAEGGLDSAITALRANPKQTAGGTTTSCTNCYRYEVTPVGMTFKEDGTLQEFGTPQAIQQITATGTSPEGRTTTLTTMVRLPQTLRDLVSNKTIVLGPKFARPLLASDRPFPKVRGNIRAAGGWPSTVWTTGTVDGNVTIGLAAASGGYTRLRGNTWNTDGVYEPGGLTSLEGIKGNVLAITSPLMPPASAPDSSRCDSQDWTVTDSYDLYDGDSHDKSPPGDGRVVICVPTVEVLRRGKLVIHDPTLLYVTGEYPATYPTGFIDTFFINNGEVKTVIGLERRPDRGLTLVVTAPRTGPLAGHAFGASYSELGFSYGNAGMADVGRFEGSVYAPESFVGLVHGEVEMRTSNPSSKYLSPNERKVSFVVGQDIQVLSDVDVRQTASQTQSTSSATPAILSWTD